MSGYLQTLHRDLMVIGDPDNGPDAPIDDSRRDIRFGIIVAGLFFVLFLGWAALTPLDAAAYASGQLVVSGERRWTSSRKSTPFIPGMI